MFLLAGMSLDGKVSGIIDQKVHADQALIIGDISCSRAIPFFHAANTAVTAV